MERKTAIAYYRTSSASGVGEDKDSKPRQSDACAKYALLQNIEIIAEFYDANVRGTVKIEDRPEFSRLLDFAQKKKVGLVIVETANRFSRDVMVQLMGHDLLTSLSIQLVPTDAPEHFKDEDNPTAEMLRIIIAAVSMYQKKSANKVMAAGKERMREKTGRCEGRSLPLPDAIALAKKLRAEGMPFQKIGEELSKAGFRVREKDDEGILRVTDRVYQSASVRNMILNL